MPKTRPPYSPEFRHQMVDLVRAGRDPAELAPRYRLPFAFRRMPSGTNSNGCP